jgi:acyl-CoA thioesterase I
MSRILCVLLALLAFDSHATTLLIYGDSLSAGYQLPAEKSWPSLLNHDWQAQSLDLQIINASVSGETTQGGLARLDKTLQTHTPDWVLVELGANDGLRGLPPTLTRQNLDQMLQRIQRHGARAILTQIRLPPNYGSRYIGQFETLYPELAKQYQIPLIPFFMEAIITDPALLLGDGLHPNSQGQEKIRDQLGPILMPLLTRH